MKDLKVIMLGIILMAIGILLVVYTFNLPSDSIKQYKNQQRIQIEKELKEIDKI